MSVNLCVFTGRTTRDLEMRYTSDSKAIGRFSLAVDSGFGDNKKTSFFNMVAFGKTAESLEKYAPKGTKLILQCSASQNTYTNKDGVKINDVQFIVNSYEFAESRRNGNDNSSIQPSANANDGFLNIPDGIEDAELPFV